MECGRFCEYALLIAPSENGSSQRGGAVSQGTQEAARRSSLGLREVPVCAWWLKSVPGTLLCVSTEQQAGTLTFPWGLPRGTFFLSDPLIPAGRGG